MDRIRRRFTELKTTLAGIQQRRSAARAAHAAVVRKADDDGKKIGERAAQELTEKLEALQTSAAENVKAEDARWNSRTAKVKAAASKLKAKIQRQMLDQSASWNQQKLDAQARVSQQHEKKVTAFQSLCANALADLAALDTAIDSTRSKVERFARERGARLNKKVCVETGGVPVIETEGVAPIAERLGEIDDALQSHKLPFFGKIPPLATYGIIIAIHVTLWGWLTKFEWRSPIAFGVLASCIVFLFLSFSIYSSIREKVAEFATSLMWDTNECAAAVAREKLRDHERSMQGFANLGCEFVQNQDLAEKKVRREMELHNGPNTNAMAALDARRNALAERIAVHQKLALQKMRARSAQKEKDLRAENERETKQRQDDASAQKRDSEQRVNALNSELAAQWKKELAEIRAFVDELNAGFKTSHPSWKELKPNSSFLPLEFSREVPIGALNFDLKSIGSEADATGDFALPNPSTLAVPLTLSFPLNGSLYIRAEPTARDAAMDVISSTVLRLLRSFPPAKCKLTIIDPVGLGQSFAGLMHLADYDETLVNGRIWSDGAHIERKLTELTEHMEKVIQKFLRNRYESIDAYNIEAGQMAEPYRFVVIADFPSGFSELAQDRLASIIKSGVRCGVYTIILHNARAKLPQNFDMQFFKQNGLVLTQQGTGFALEDECFQHVPAAIDAPPSSAQVDELVNAVGRQCREASRVQVPFDVVLPKPEQIWSGSTELSVRVPLGKSGADRLQFLELGKGTAQHALIAGKTGSGKSNLFHVIITNAATWYSPRELEFYLIDFKKGVEFKTYGVHRLRHARVVAVESDREFALSVLRRIDRELTLRGELFRKARVQDFPSFRKVNPNVVMPRTLLMIDEFQEFFTDDDSVAQDAALLLDRIVRQGRAFGIHVILGSQTLGGTYSLSKSTLGQVVVRIALQCNEADSYLVLSDDNAAASLLTRPGDAIYNDMSGLIEGNNPFQAVWLPRDKQDVCLTALQLKAVEGGLEAVEPLVVFEGSSLSDLSSNLLLRSTALQEPQAASKAPRIWLGEPNAIKGPTELEFGRQAGSNVLILGHRGDTEMAMACAAVASLVANCAVEAVSIKILDGAHPDSPGRERLKSLMKLLPHDIELCDFRRVPEVLGELAAEVKNRQEKGASLDKRIFVLVLGLEKFRMLRQEDEFSFSSSSSEEGATAAPSKSFTDILLEGPNAGVHSLVWCDTLSNLNRAMSRKTLREFEMRVLFQMSASDSSELVDSPAANKLGMYNALFYSASNGSIEKFRPYEAPDKEFIDDFARMIAPRAPASAPGVGKTA